MTKILSFDFEFEHDYTLIGIHAALEDYRLAYFLNQNLNLQFKRFKQDLDFPSQKSKFSVFNFDDEKTFTNWALISNKYSMVTSSAQDQFHLFGQESKLFYLIPEKKQVDYFIKISGEQINEQVNTVLAKINQTYNVITSYTIDPYELKSKDNLIF